jgi:hypothetical protein
MTTPTAKSKKPSKEFLAALKDLKLIWDAGRIYFHMPELKERTRIKLQKQDDLVELGRKEGLSPKFVYHELRTSIEKLRKEHYCVEEQYPPSIDDDLVRIVELY